MRWRPVPIHRPKPSLIGGNLNYYRRFPGDYASDTHTLTTRQHGAYTLLLDYQYSTERPILSIRHANQICRAERNNPEGRSDQRAVKFILETYFQLEPDGYWNKRVKEEIKYTSDRREKARDAALAGHKRDKFGTKTGQERDTNGTQTGQQNSINFNGINNEHKRTLSNRTAILDSRLQTPDKEKSKSNTYARTWPVDLILLTGMREHALINGVDNPELEFEHWRDDCQAHGRKYVNWMAAWRNRIANYEKFNGGTGNAESFDQGKRRRSGGAIGEVAAGAGGLVQKMDRCLPDARSNQITNDGLRGSLGRPVA